MTKKEIPSEQVAAETKTELYSPEGFIRKLHGGILEWLLKEKKGHVIENLGPQTIYRRDSHEFQPGRSVDLAADIERATLISTSEEDFALVLGKRRRSKYDQKETLGIQFGLFPKSHTIHHEELPAIERVHRLINQQFTYGSAEFYIDDMTDEVRNGAWADQWIFGGQNFGRWEKEKKLTDKGLQACLQIVQRTTKDAFL